MGEGSRVDSARIVVIGMSAAGASGLPAARLAQIAQADLLVGGKRHLGYFPDFAGETLAITTNMDAVAARLRTALDRQEATVVLASGDPLCYGMGATLRRYFSAETLHIIPSPSAFQLAFAALGEAWHDATLVSAHGRPLWPVLAQCMTQTTCAVLTDNRNTPSEIARQLLDLGLAPETNCAICENLGSADERIVRTTLAEASTQTFAKLNVFVLWNETPIRPIAAGLADADFSTHAGQITKREVRLLALAELGLQAGEVLWDIGAGSGSVGIEAARAQPLARVFSAEKRPALCTHIRENLRRFPAFNLNLSEGTAPEICADWPNPDAVFIGGGGAGLTDIISETVQRMTVGGRIVANVVTFESLQRLRDLLPDATVAQVAVSRGKPIVGMLRLEALNPIFIVTWEKSDGRE